MLPKAYLRTTSRILLVFYVFFALELPLRADDFTSSVEIGRSMGQSSVTDFSPSNLNQTLQNKNLGTASALTPQAGQATGQKATYEGYYSNQGALTGASSDIGDFVNGSSQTRTKYDLTTDGTFASACLEKDGAGKCTKWSTSGEILGNTYPDCEEVKIPRRDAEPTEATCTGTRNTTSADCLIRTIPRVTSETRQVRCAAAPIPYEPGQVYAVCKDNDEFFKVYRGTAIYKDDCFCPNHLVGAPEYTTPTYSGCGDIDPIYTLPGSPPGGATFLGRRLSGTQADSCEEVQGSWDKGTWTFYDWYEKYTGSTIERVFLDSDSSCGDMTRFGDSSCTMARLEQCDSSGGNCVLTVDNGESTGQSVSPPAPQLCTTFTGSIENYQVCVNSSNVTLEGHTLTTTQQTITANGLLHIYGGADVPTQAWFLSGFYKHAQIACNVENDDCQALRDQGCKMYKRTCVDPTDFACPQVNYVYRCGGTGEVLGYDTSIICDGNVRCMGSECKDTSHNANKDFAAIPQAMEILNAIRSDQAGQRIFPGKERSCQSGPIQCCNANSSGVSIGEYILAAKEAASLYATLSTGIAETGAAMAANATVAYNTGMVATGLTNATTTMVTVGAETVATTTATTAAGVTTSTTIAIAETGAVVGSTGAGAASVAPMLGALCSCLAFVGVLIAIYVIATTLYKMVFACTAEDMATSVDLGFNLCHLVGQRSGGATLGMSLKKRNVYCCFSSILARLVHEQGRPQVNRSWGSPETPDCTGFTFGEFATLDFSVMDLSEYMQHIKAKVELTPAQAQAIQERALKLK